MRSQINVKEITYTTWVGLLINVVLATFKIFAGVVGHSYAVLADGFHSLSDLATDVVVLVGVRYWSAEPDESHPYGHERLEHFISLIIAVALMLTALSIVWASLQNFLAGNMQRTTQIAVVAALSSIVIKEALYRWTMLQGRKYRSTALFANAWHHRSDALSSIPAVLAAGVVSLHPELAVVDLIGAVLVGIFIIYAAWKIARPAAFALMDGSAGRETRKKIYRTAAAVAGVKNAHGLRTRFLGQGVDVNMHVMVESQISVEAGHDIAHAVEAALYNLGPEITNVTIHIEPWYPPKSSLAKPVSSAEPKSTPKPANWGETTRPANTYGEAHLSHMANLAERPKQPKSKQTYSEHPEPKKPGPAVPLPENQFKKPGNGSQ